MNSVIESCPDSLDLPNSDLSSIIQCVIQGTTPDEEVEIQMQCHKIALCISVKFPELFLQNIVSLNLTPLFIKLLPVNAIAVDKQAHDELVSSALPVLHAYEELIYSNKYLSKTNTFVALRGLVTSCFGALDCGRLYKHVVDGLMDEEVWEMSLQILITLWTQWDTKIEDSEFHKVIAKSIYRGFDSVINTISQHNTSNPAWIMLSLKWVHLVEVAMSRMEKKKKKLELLPHEVFMVFLKNTKKGALASKYAEISK